jgi:hypothetical protein
VFSAQAREEFWWLNYVKKISDSGNNSSKLIVTNKINKNILFGMSQIIDQWEFREYVTTFSAYLLFDKNPKETSWATLFYDYLDHLGVDGLSDKAVITSALGAQGKIVFRARTSAGQNLFQSPPLSLLAPANNSAAALFSILFGKVPIAA